MDPRLLDVLHDPADHDLAGVVADGVDVDLGGVLEEPVDQHRSLGRQAALLAEACRSPPARPSPGGAPPRRRRSPSPDRRARSWGRSSAGIADAPDRRPGPRRRWWPCPRRAAGSRAGRTARSTARGPRPVDRRGRRAEHELGRQLRRQLERRLAAEGDDDAHQVAELLLRLDHVEDVLERERLEVQAVGRVVVGRDRLGVAVDHHGLEAGVGQGEAGVDAAVVELDALADAVGPRAEDDHLAAARWRRPRPRPRRSSSGTASRRRTRRRRCRPS